MNNGAQGGQPPQGQPFGAQQQQQQRRQMPLYRPEQMRSLPDQFSQQEKDKWETGLRALWKQMESNGPETQMHQDAKRKLLEFSRTLAQKVQNFRMQAAQQAQQGQQPQQGQQSQQPPQDGTNRPPSQGQAQQTQGGESSGANQNAAQQQRQGPKISQKVMDHVSNFPYVLPPQLTAGTPEASKWLQDAKSRYLKGLVTMENTTARVSHLDAVLQKRTEEGNPLSAEEEKEWKEKKEIASKTHSDAKNFVDTFRNQQAQQRAAAAAAANANSNSNQAPAQQQAGGNANNIAQNGTQRPQMNSQQQAPNSALQTTQTVNAAIEAARNQQLGGSRPPMTQNGQGTQPPQMQNQNAPSQPIPSMPQPQTQPPNIKSEAGIPPQINTAVSQLQQGQRGSIGNNSPQSAMPQSAGQPQSATSQGPARALTHAAALNQAARSYSNSQPSSAPNVMGHSHPSAPREGPVITNKMPIPKHLPERAAAPPQPVPVNMGRPTYSGGPANAGSGVMSQPAFPKTPGYDLQGDTDKVLSKKKLDELVRQVTGGGSGLEGGESLTPEVERSVLQVADDFVDQVLQAACKNAKERGSKVLEIRDIQLTLERGYNIRIPGYASDEIRTVRKMNPAPAWISKMSAVQAAKVTGGKNSD